MYEQRQNTRHRRRSSSAVLNAHLRQQQQHSYSQKHTYLQTKHAHTHTPPTSNITPSHLIIHHKKCIPIIRFSAESGYVNILSSDCQIGASVPLGVSGSIPGGRQNKSGNGLSVLTSRKRSYTQTNPNTTSTLLCTI